MAQATTFLVVPQAYPSSAMEGTKM